MWQANICSEKRAHFFFSQQEDNPPISAKEGVSSTAVLPKDSQ